MYTLMGWGGVGKTDVYFILRGDPKMLIHILYVGKTWMGRKKSVKMLTIVVSNMNLYKIY